MRRVPRAALVVLAVLALVTGMVWLAGPKPAVREPSDLAYLPAAALDAVKERIEAGELVGPVELVEAKTSKNGRFTRYQLRAFTTVQGRRFRVGTTVVYDRQQNTVLGWIDQ